MKTKVLIVLLGVGIASIFLLKVKTHNPIVKPINTTQNVPADETSIVRRVMDKQNLELAYVTSELPTQYFRVGKITKVGNGENMESVENWSRKVDVYDQKELIGGTCSVYEYNFDTRNQKLTAIIIKGLKPNEVETYKNKGITCSSDTGKTKKLSKIDAESIAMGYLSRAIPNFDQIKNQLEYSTQNNGESHEWLWSDKTYKLPDGISSRPYTYPTIRISVYENGEIQFWNTVPLFEN